MKRRNGECGKFRRPVKRTKIPDNFVQSIFVYVKFFLLWIFVIGIDHLLSFRFEYLWPFWLLLRSVYDSYKYQGLTFSIFFISVAMTSDIICYFVIPVQWLLFVASTYVWIQYAWQTEKGICLPTVMLWLVIAYTEVAYRIKDLKSFHVDLCRPFAAHCIGYPVVTLTFGFKGYVSYRLKQRKQKEVQKDNEFFYNLVALAVPKDQPAVNGIANSLQSLSCNEKNDVHINGEIHNSIANNHKQHRKSIDKNDRNTEIIVNGNIPHNEIMYNETKNVECILDSEIIDKVYRSTSNKKVTNNSVKGNNNNLQKNKKVVHKEHNPPTESSYTKDDNFRLETDLKRLRNEISTFRSQEQDFKQQISNLMASEKQAKLDLSNLQQTNDDLFHKHQSLLAQRSCDKANYEKKLNEEKKCRLSVENQLAQEKRSRQKAEELLTKTALSKQECTEICKTRRRELENEVKLLKRDLKFTEDKYINSDRELQSMLHLKDSANEAEILTSALTALRDKNCHLEDSLSAETRIKLDLFSALGEAKRQIEIRDALIIAKEREADQLRSKMAQVLAIMPSNDFSPFSGSPILGNGTSTNSSSKVIVTNSSLDPNASVYTPKQGRLSTEA